VELKNMKFSPSLNGFEMHVLYYLYFFVKKLILVYFDLINYSRRRHVITALDYSFCNFGRPHVSFVFRRCNERCHFHSMGVPAKFPFFAKDIFSFSFSCIEKMTTASPETVLLCCERHQVENDTRFIQKKRALDILQKVCSPGQL
jgi:hypothetical protein